MKIHPAMLSGVAAALTSASCLGFWLHGLTASANIQQAANPAEQAPPMITAFTPDMAKDWTQRFLTACHTWTSKDGQQLERSISPAAVTLLDDLTPADCEEVLRQNETDSDEVRRDWIGSEVFEHFSCIAPARSLSLAQEWPASLADARLSPLLAAWKNLSPDAAKWVESLMKEKPGEWIKIRELFAPLPRAEPAVATPVPRTFAEALTESEKRMAAQPPGTSSSTDIEPLTAWAASTSRWEAVLDVLTPEKTASQSYRQSIHMEWAASDWRSWLEWMTQHPEEGREADGQSFHRDFLHSAAAGSAIDKLLRETPNEETAAFLTAWKDHWAKGPCSGTLDHLFAQWLTSDPGAASAWLDAQPAAPWKDRAADTLATATAGDDPQRAFAWVESISDPATRDSARLNCWREWNKLDPAAAESWADAHHPELRTTITPGPQN